MNLHACKTEKKVISNGIHREDASTNVDSELGEWDEESVEESMDAELSMQCIEL